MLTQASQILKKIKIKPFKNIRHHQHQKELQKNSKSLVALPKIKETNLSVLIKKSSNKNIKTHKKCLTELTTNITKHSRIASIPQQEYSINIDKQIQHGESKICSDSRIQRQKKVVFDQFNSILQFYINIWMDVSQSNKNQVQKQMYIYFKRMKYPQVLLKIWKQCISQSETQVQFTEQKINKLLIGHSNILQQMTKVGNNLLYVVSSNKKNRWYELKGKIRKAQIQKDKTIQDIAVNLKKTTLSTRYNIVKSVQAIDWNLKAQNIRYESWMQNAIKHFRQNGVKCQLLKRQIYNYY